MTEDIKNVTRTGLILAVTLILQGLRLVIPIPPQVSMFVVGSLVNACLIVAVLLIGRRAGLFLPVGFRHVLQPAPGPALRL